ncbi:helix-turn-helix transcriptional regulator [Rhodopirellula baltica]
MQNQANQTPPLTDGFGRALLSTEDVANDYLKCSARHVRRLADSGRMPRPIKLGTLSRWPRFIIEDWIAAGCPNVRNTAKGAKR